MSNRGEPSIEMRQVIKVLRRNRSTGETTCRPKSEWMVIIPPKLAFPELEAQLWFRDGDDHPVSRTTLADGSILLSGD
jgi:hypothetical protein